MGGVGEGGLENQDRLRPDGARRPSAPGPGTQGDLPWDLGTLTAMVAKEALPAASVASTVRV